MRPNVTETEHAAIEAVKAAIKALPRGILVEIDDTEGCMCFWKREPGFFPGMRTAGAASSNLKCRRVFCL